MTDTGAAPERGVLGTSVVIATNVAPIPGVLAISAVTLAESGRRPRGRVTDLLIAATAHAHDACVYTRNVDDFAGLEGLVEVRRA